MALQYISDSKGKTTGVYIPLSDWQKLKKKYKELENDEASLTSVPQWQIDLVRERIQQYNNKPDSWLDFDDTMNRIEKDL
jgi:hypothetical protein